MANVFMKVDKRLFNSGLSPVEILIVAQIAEFQTNTGNCFISDKVLAENFGVSESTIGRALKALEAKGYITRETKNCKGGKERHLRINESALFPTSSKMKLDSSAQPSNCSLTTSKLTFDNKQNDLIKDNIKDKEKDNITELLPNGNNSCCEPLPSGKSSCNYPIVTVGELVRHGVEYELIENSDSLIRVKATGAIVKVV